MGVSRPSTGAVRREASGSYSKPAPSRPSQTEWKCLSSGESDRMRGQQGLTCHLRGEAPAPAHRADPLRGQESPAASPTPAQPLPPVPPPLDGHEAGRPHAAQRRAGLDRHQLASRVHRSHGSELPVRVYLIQANTAMASDGG